MGLADRIRIMLGNLTPGEIEERDAAARLRVAEPERKAQQAAQLAKATAEARRAAVKAEAEQSIAHGELPARGLDSSNRQHRPYLGVAYPKPTDLAVARRVYNAIALVLEQIDADTLADAPGPAAILDDRPGLRSTDDEEDEVDGA